MSEDELKGSLAPDPEAGERGIPVHPEGPSQNPADLMAQLAKALGSDGIRPQKPQRKFVSFKDITGANSSYRYKALANFDVQVIKSYCSSLHDRFRSQTSLPEASEEWMVRTHVAVKLLLSATVMLSSAEFAESVALRIAEPYLLYYALFNTSRAFVFVVPEQGWKDGKLLDETTHTKTINVTADQLAQVSSQGAVDYRELARRALATRELFSYKFPSRGLKGPVADFFPKHREVFEACELVGELAQLNSECLENAFRELGRPFGIFAEAPLRRFYEYDHKFLNDPVHDDDDYYRLGRILMNFGRPLSLESTATEGLVEDFVNCWDFSKSDERKYNPNESWSSFFDFY